MCTAVTYETQDFYFGRNLDLEYSYGETVTITPRNYSFQFRKAGRITHHYAMIGMAYIAENYPLYYEATNEMGLSMAGLNFPDYAHYPSAADDRDNIAPFELIPWILSQCADLNHARALLKRMQLVEMHFRDDLPLTPLHWIVADRSGALTVECVKDGMRIAENPVGILTNSPPFDYHLLNLNNYMQISAAKPVNFFSERLSLQPYSLGMGSIGLPGDFSSASRFVRAAFVKMNAVSEKNEDASVSQFFHILSSVEQPKGCTLVRDHEYEITQYSSCCNTQRGIYYYKTYENSQITGVDMHLETLDACELISYPLILEQQIRMQNKKTMA